MSDSSLESEALRFEEEVARWRSAGRVRVVVESFAFFSLSENLAPRLDAAVKKQGLHPLGKAWREVSLKTAREILRRVLCYDMAYNGKQMSNYRADTLIKRFLSLTDVPRRYFTNGMFEPDYGGWKPLTDATFDTGILCVSEKRLALLWVEDED